MTDHVDRRNFRVTGRHRAHRESHVEALEGDEGVTVIITQAFGPGGHSLIGVSDEKFDGHPALTLLVEADGKQGLLHLSPIHGDTRKRGFTDIAPGTRCQLLCPVSKRPLDRVPGYEGDGDYFAIYLTPALSEGSMFAMSNVWGRFNSRIIDNFELISMWLRQE